LDGSKAGVPADVRTAFLALSGEPEPTRHVADALPWVYDASCPYVDWLFDGGEQARATLERWMRRPSAELFLGRAVLFHDEDRLLGGYIALPGDELQSCRKADALAVAMSDDTEQRQRTVARLGEGARLFHDVSPDELYLSRMGLNPSARGAGHGATILREFLASGRHQGFRRFRLDVWDGNSPAIRLCRSAGFEPIGEATSSEAGMTYLNMALELRGRTGRFDRARP
jgi:ribosomal protein S18 acetylase RimI-like enzyme